MEVNSEALRVIRERSGFSVGDLAEKAGLSQPHLSNIENGKRRTTPPAVKRLADALQVPMVALLADPPGRQAIKEILALVEDRRESAATNDASDLAAWPESTGDSEPPPDAGRVTSMEPRQLLEAVTEAGEGAQRVAAMWAASRPRDEAVEALVGEVLARPEIEHPALAGVELLDQLDDARAAGALERIAQRHLVSSVVELAAHRLRSMMAEPVHEHRAEGSPC